MQSLTAVGAGLSLLGALVTTDVRTALRRTGSEPDSARVWVERAAEAMGGPEAIRSLPTIHREFVVEISDPTQGARPLAPAVTEPEVYLRDRRVLDVDYAADRQRTYVEGTIYGNQPTRLLRVDRPDSTAGVNLALGTSFGFPGGSGTAPRGQLMAESLVRRALLRPDSLEWAGFRNESGGPVAVIRFAEPGVPFAQRLLIDQATGRLVALEADTDDPVLGDVLTRFEYLDYRPAGYLTLPYRIVQRRNGVRYQTYVTRELALGRPMPDSVFTVPSGYPVDQSQPRELTVRAVGRDLYLVRAAYNSLFLVASDHVVVVEAPVNSRRSMQVLAEIRAVAPDKPIRYVVATHFHGDHIGGLRPFIAAGTTIVTTATARQVIERDLVRGARTRSPDTLVTSPRPPVVEVVQGHRILGDPSHPVHVIDVGPNPHADEILIAWFPTEKLLFQGDMLDLLVPEGRPSMPGDDTRALARSIAQLGLSVDRIIPVHGRPGSKADLDSTLARADR